MATPPRQGDPDPALAATQPTPSGAPPAADLALAATQATPSGAPPAADLALAATQGPSTVFHAPAPPDLALAATTAAAGDRAATAIPATLGRYQVRELLGKGGMGVVFAADDPELGRTVAIKVLGSIGDAAARQRLTREAQAMARVAHPNVIAVHDVGTVDDQVFVAMELCKGGTLRDWLRTPRDRRAILDAFVAAGRGLAAAHAAGLVHRDFKPDNVLCGDGRFRVTDFGLARPEGELGEPPTDGAGSLAGLASPLMTPLTQAGSILGTPAYMPPEQLRGRNVDARSDQFSFAVALYEALYGERPFPEDSFEALRDAVERGAIKPAPRGAAVPTRLRAIVVRALSARPGDRFATMDALLDALSRDRTRVPRAVARLSLALLVPLAVAVFADWIVRERTLAVAQSSFAAARDQLGRLLAARAKTFRALSDMFYVTPVTRQVTARVDESDFGLSAPEDDRAALIELHDSLRSATWTWATTLAGSDFAIADYKGRLLYTSAAPDVWGGEVRAVAAIDHAFERGADVTSALVRGDDRALIGSGVTGGELRPGLVVLFARAIVIAERPQAVFVQAEAGAQLLADVSLGEATELSLVAPDGTAAGTVPDAVVGRATQAGAAPTLIDVDGADWLVQRHALGEAGTGIGSIVLARPLDVGLAGLFAGARVVFAAAAAGLLALALAATVLARRR